MSRKLGRVIPNIYKDQGALQQPNWSSLKSEKKQGSVMAGAIPGQGNMDNKKKNRIGDSGGRN